MPFNAGTTASDAIWSGLPLLTIEGKSYSGRMASSFLRATGMNQLVARDVGEYSDIAINLARDPDLYNVLRNQLNENIAKSKVFDAKEYTNSLENAFTKLI